MATELTTSHESIHAKISKLIADDGLTVEKHTIFDIQNKRGEHIACIYFEAKYIKFNDEYRQYASSFPGLIALINSGYRSNKI